MQSTDPAMNQSSFHVQVAQGERFKFGKNWQNFLDVLTNERITVAEHSLQEMLRLENLSGKTFLDVGSGSGLFSLAARRLGAKVYSFDYDPKSVACTQALQSKYFPDDAEWIIQRGSILDPVFMRSLETYDIVYAWGVLHHTGNLWYALENVLNLPKIGGQLFVAIYNDQNWKSKFWYKVKRCYCSGVFGKTVIISIFIPYCFIMAVTASILRRKNVFASYKKNRGMSITHDWFDWLGGLPYEVASVERITDFVLKHGFRLDKMRTANGGLANNEFIFTRES